MSAKELAASRTRDTLPQRAAEVRTEWNNFPASVSVRMTNCAVVVFNRYLFLDAPVGNERTDHGSQLAWTIRIR